MISITINSNCYHRTNNLPCLPDLWTEEYNLVPLTRFTGWRGTQRQTCYKIW